MRWGHTILLFCVGSLFCVEVFAPTSVGAEPATRTESCAEVAKRVDELLASQWAAADIRPAETCSDEQFVRRAYLD